MPKQYDLVIIGTGTAAMVAAMQAHAAQWRVAVIDFRPFGGTCALRGCDPKKFLRSGGEVVDHVQRMHDKGAAGDVHIAWPVLMAFKRSFTDPVPAKNERRYADKSVDAYHGKTKFVRRDAVEVNGETLEAKHVLIASGAEPVKLGIPGEEHVITNEEFMNLEQLPPRIALVGGGSGFEPELVAWLMEKSRSVGIDVRTQTAVTAVEANGRTFRVRATADGKEVKLETDLVVHAAGRMPALGELDLATAGVETRNGRLVLNDFLQSVSNPLVYAAGDAAQVGPPLTPVSSHDAKVAVANMLDGNKQKPNYAGVPSVAFTIPPIASVGLSEAKAREAGLKFRVHTEKASDWFTARQAAEPTYGFKVLVDEKTDRVLGAHLVGPNVDEVINIFALAIRHGLTTAALKSTMFAYPTGASDIGYML
jgi:glutathione reductase (NADPH)